jgi:hypothetical protein
MGISLKFESNNQKRLNEADDVKTQIERGGKLWWKAVGITVIVPRSVLANFER